MRHLSIIDDSDGAIRCPDPANGETIDIERMFYGISSELPFELALMAEQIKRAISELDLRWINAEEDRAHLYTFRNCCEYLGIDHRRARAALNRRLGPLFREKLKVKKVAAPVPRAECPDIPGKTFTHRYGECPPGVASSRCAECRQRYAHKYWREWRVRGTTQRAAAAQVG